MTKNSANLTYVVVIFRKGQNLPFVLVRKKFHSLDEVLAFVGTYLSSLSQLDKLYVAEMCVMENCIGFLNVVPTCVPVR